MSIARTLLALTAVAALVGCGANQDPLPLEGDAAIVEGPDPAPRICSPGDTDPANCKSCVGGVIIQAHMTT